MINIFFLLILCLLTITSHRVGSHSTLKEDLELERQLKLINKLPIKSIHTKFGYIVDCVDINKQPAFDHPLLKDHKLQRRPIFHMKNEKISAKNSPTNLIFRLEKEECPTGTVPIRRTTKDDLIRSKSLWNAVSPKESGQHYYGVSGTTSIYNPKTHIYQASSSHVYIQSGDGTNKIIVGWHVFPFINGDDRPHVFAEWRSNNFNKTSGCYNTKCLGFVQVDNQFHIGQVLPNVSVYGGSMSDLPINIYQAVGYFPVALFNNLNAADEVGWGGVTINSDSPSPPMGSGYFPDGNPYHSCYFKNIAYKNAIGSGDFRPNKVQEISDGPKCYGVKYQSNDYSVLFEGPGGLAHLFGIISIILLLVWLVHYREGIDYDSDYGLRVFDVHPLMMFLGFIFLVGEGIC
ncbi:hypothetical protein QL285_049469 [Trifolium repens]|nr:hypothetical protein QL285_049469 [Trifolium repens]